MQILDNDMIYEIMSHLDQQDLLNMSTVCKQFNLVYKNDLLWKYKCFNVMDNKTFTGLCKYFGLSDICDNRYFECYKKWHMICKLKKYIVGDESVSDIISSTEIEIRDVLEKIPDGLFLLTKTEKLYLGSIYMEQIPAKISCFENLKVLDMSYNCISELPKELFLLENLEELYLNDNRIEKIPTEIAQLNKLQMLYLDFNCIEEIPVEIAQLTQLERLYLNNNCITEIPKELSQLGCMICLDLSYNAIEKVPVELSQLNKSEIFVYSNWPIHIPEELRQMMNFHFFSKYTR